MLEDENFRYLFLSLKDDDLSTYSIDPELYEEYKKKMLAQGKAAATGKIDLTEEVELLDVRVSKSKKQIEELDKRVKDKDAQLRALIRQ